MAINWARIFNQLFELIDGPRPGYFSGGRYLDAVREIDRYHPYYSQYIEQRKGEGKSTSRRIYFFDVLMAFDEEDRGRLLDVILNQLTDQHPDKVAAIRSELHGTAPVPTPKLHSDDWNSERVSRLLQDIDNRIASRKFGGAITLAYTALEGFLKGFVARHSLGVPANSDIVQMSKAVRGYLRSSIDQYPDEAINMVMHVAHTVDRARNQFSESHFDGEADAWLAVFVRDLVNAELRLLLHFM